MRLSTNKWAPINNISAIDQQPVDQLLQNYI